MKPQFFPLLSTAVLAATAGFVAGSALWPSGISSTALGWNGAAGDSPADSGKIQSSAKNGVAPGSGGSRTGGGSGSVGGLTARFAALLKQSGTDTSWAAGLAAADTAGFEGLLEKMKSLPAGQQERLREFLLGRWAELDPAGGVAFFKSRKDEDGLADLFRQWQRLDFPAAAAKAGEEGDKILRRTLRDKALLDPAGLMAWLADRPDLNPLSLFSTESEDNARALLRMAETDPDKMLAWTRQLPEDKWDRGFLQGLAAQLASRDPDQALAWAKSIRDPAKSAAAVASVAGALGKSSPERALSLAAGLSQGSDYDSRGNLYNALGKVDVKDAATVEALAKGMPEGEARKRFVRSSVIKLLGSDPASAFALSERLGAGAGERWFPGSLPASARTPEGARRILEAAEGAKDSVDRESAAKESLISWMEKDPVSLAAYLKEKGDTPLLTSMKESLQKALATQQRRDGQADPGLVAQVGLPPEASVKSQMWEDPASAARSLEAVEDPAARSLLAREVAESYVRQDRTQALAWAQSATDPEVRAAAWKAIAADWVGEDSWQASQWVAQLPEGKGRDSAVLAMTEGINKTDPDLAWQWALSMGDPDLKNQALAAAAQEWARKDASALQKALSEGTLTPAQRQAVLEKLKTPSAKAP